MTTQRLRLGQLLVDAKMISEQALSEVLATQRADGRRLGTLLVERGLINETQLTQILSHQLSVPWVSLLHIEFSRRLLNLVPKEVAERYCLVPIYVRNVRKQGETLYVAMDDPSNEEGLRACSEHSGLPVRAMIAPPQDIRNAIRVYYGATSAQAAQPTTSTSIPATAAAVIPPTFPADPPAAQVSAAHAAVAPASEVSAFAPAAPSTPRPVLELVPDPTPDLTAELVPEEAAPPIEPTPIVSVDGSREPMPRPEPPRAPAGTSRSAPPPRPSRPAPRGDAAAPVELPGGPPARRSAADRLRAILQSEPAPPKPPSSPPPPPPSERAPKEIPAPRGRAPRMVSLTLLDGTTLTLPAARAKRRADDEEVVEEEPTAQPDAPPAEAMLTARDLVDALGAAARGADASEVLGPNPRWEAMFGALLSVLLKKHLIADWEFVDEYKKLL